MPSPTPLPESIAKALEIEIDIIKAKASLIRVAHLSMVTHLATLSPPVRSALQCYADQILANLVKPATPAAPVPLATTAATLAALPAATTANAAASKPKKADWASIASKAPAAKPTATSVPLPPSKKLPTNPSHAKTEILLRASLGANIRLADPTFVAREIKSLVPAVKEASFSVRLTKAGFTASFPDPKHADLLLGQNAAIQARLGLSPQLACKWIGYVVKRIPTQIFCPASGGATSTTLEDISNIATEATGHKPTRVNWSQHNKEGLVKDAVLFFPCPVAPFSIGSSAKSRACKPCPTIVQCSVCFGFHATASCTKNSRCVKCGRAAHNGICTQARCTNCLGSHAADSSSCPLRPSIKRGRLVSPSADVAKETRKTNASSKHALACIAATAPAVTPSCQPTPAPHAPQTAPDATMSDPFASSSTPSA